jgi:hypothetical protein
METVTLILAVARCVAGVLIVALAALLALRRVPRDPYYGSRSRPSMASDEAWYAVNRHAAVRMIARAGCPMIALGAAVAAARPAPGPASAAALALAPLALLVPPLIQTACFGRRHVPRDPPEDAGDDAGIAGTAGDDATRNVQP